MLQSLQISCRNSAQILKKCHEIGEQEVQVVDSGKLMHDQAGLVSHFIRLVATLVTTSLPASNRRGMRFANLYTLTPSFT